MTGYSISETTLRKTDAAISVGLSTWFQHIHTGLAKRVTKCCLEIRMSPRRQTHSRTATATHHVWEPTEAQKQHLP